MATTQKKCGHCEKSFGRRIGFDAGTCVRRRPPNTDHCGKRLCYHCSRVQMGKSKCMKRPSKAKLVS